MPINPFINPMPLSKMALLLILVAVGCGDNVPAPAPLVDAMAQVDAPAPPVPDASPAPDADPPCVLTYQWTATTTDFSPPYTTVEPAERLAIDSTLGGGLGIDDGFLDVGEVLTIAFDRPVRVVGYRLAHPEDGTDPLRFVGEHNFVVVTADGEQHPGYHNGRDNLIPIQVADATLLELHPISDRFAIGNLEFDRCNAPAPPDAGL